MKCKVFDVEIILEVEWIDLALGKVGLILSVQKDGWGKTGRHSLDIPANVLQRIEKEQNEALPSATAMPTLGPTSAPAITPTAMATEEIVPTDTETPTATMTPTEETAPTDTATPTVEPETPTATATPEISETATFTPTPEP